MKSEVTKELPDGTSATIAFEIVRTRFEAGAGYLPIEVEGDMDSLERIVDAYGEEEVWRMGHQACEQAEEAGRVQQGEDAWDKVREMEL
jgi:hypothetical protein